MPAAGQEWRAADAQASRRALRCVRISPLQPYLPTLSLNPPHAGQASITPPAPPGSSEGQQLSPLHPPSVLPEPTSARSPRCTQLCSPSSGTAGLRCRHHELQNCSSMQARRAAAGCTVGQSLQRGEHRRRAAGGLTAHSREVTFPFDSFVSHCDCLTANTGLLECKQPLRSSHLPYIYMLIPTPIDMYAYSHSSNYPKRSQCLCFLTLPQGDVVLPPG